MTRWSRNRLQAQKATEAKMGPCAPSRCAALPPLFSTNSDGYVAPSSSLLLLLLLLFLLPPPPLLLLLLLLLLRLAMTMIITLSSSPTNQASFAHTPSTTHRQSVVGASRVCYSDNAQTPAKPACRSVVGGVRARTTGSA